MYLTNRDKAKCFAALEGIKWHRNNAFYITSSDVYLSIGKATVHSNGDVVFERKVICNILRGDEKGASS